MARLLPLLSSAVVSIAVLMSLQLIGGMQQLTSVRVSHAQAAPAYPLKASSNGRYLVDQNNQPFFVNGDAAWSLIAQGTNTDIDTYLTSRQQLGFNVVLVNLIEHLYATNAPKDINGDPPFTGTTFTTPNDVYFQHADYVVSDAASKGIVVLLDPLYLGANCDNEGWCSEVKAASTSDMQTWGTYVGNRYKTYNNIIWVVGGDMDPTTVSTNVSAFATALAQADGRHLITAHNTHEQMAVTPWQGATWLTLNSTYTYNPNYELAQTAYNYTPVMPFFQIESTYENEHSSTQQQLRREAYWTVLSGGMGYIYGNCPIWNLGVAASSFCPAAGSNWQTWLNSTGANAMKHVSDVFTGRAWQDLVPDTTHIVVTSGYGTYGNTNYVTTERTGDGSLVMAYLPMTTTVTVDMSKLNGPATGSWYDPTNGTYLTITGSPFANTGTQTFSSPPTNAGGDSDWVLILGTGVSGPTATPTNTPTLTPTIMPATATPAPTPLPSGDLALAATANASSANTSTGQTADKAIDGVVSGYPQDPTAEWATVGGGAGSWLKLSWSSPQTVTRIVLNDRPNLNDQVTGGNVQFSDGSSVPVGTLNNDGSDTTITFAAKTITSLQLNVTSVSSTTRNVGLAEIQVYNDGTSTPVPTDTPTNTPVPTNTAVATNTPTAANTPTNTPVAANTATNTPVPSNTPTNTPLPTNTPTRTPVPTNTPTRTPTPRPTNTPTATPTPCLLVCVP